MLGKVIELIVFLALVILVRILTKNIRPEIKYDERQKEIIAKGYKYGFYTAVFGNLIGFGVLDSSGNLPLGGDFIMICIMFTAGSVFVVYSILRGAYFGIDNRWKIDSVLMIGLGAVLELGAISYFLKNGLTDGKLGFEYIGIPAGIFLVLSGIVAIIAGLRSSREDAE